MPTIFKHRQGDRKLPNKMVFNNSNNMSVKDMKDLEAGHLQDRENRENPKHLEKKQLTCVPVFVGALSSALLIAIVVVICGAGEVETSAMMGCHCSKTVNIKGNVTGPVSASPLDRTKVRTSAHTGKSCRRSWKLFLFTSSSHHIIGLSKEGISFSNWGWKGYNFYATQHNNCRLHFRLGGESSTTFSYPFHQVSEVRTLDNFFCDS